MLSSPRTESRELFRQFVSRKEKAQLEARGVFRVGAVDCVVLDVGSPLLANRAFFRLGGVGGAHQLAQVGDGVFFFQSENDDGSAGHEIGERAEKWAGGVDGVELFRLVL